MMVRERGKSSPRVAKMGGRFVVRKIVIHSRNALFCNNK